MEELKEEFKYLDFTDNRYMISNLGNIYSLYGKGRAYKTLRKIPLKMRPSVNNCGYAQIGFNVNGKYRLFLVHRLVAMYFVDNPNGYTEVNHIDEDKLNNQADNLEWCTHKYNVCYGERNNKVSNNLSQNAIIYKFLNYEKWIPELIEKVNFDLTDNSLYRDNGAERSKSYKVIWKDNEGNVKKIFNDIHEAAEYFHLTIARISQICKHKNSKKIFLEYGEKS